MMRTILNTRPAAAFTLPLALVLTAPAAATAQATPDRSSPPPVGPVPELRLPEPVRFTLDNGLDVLLVEKHDLPLVQVNLIVGAGSVRDGAEIGLASMTADMLDEGAADMSALEIADAFETLGARFSIDADQHAAQVSLRVPVARLDSALALFGDVVLQPDFPAAELDRLREERLTELLRRRDQPGAIADVMLLRTLFGEEHPYGSRGFGTAESLAALSVEDMRAFHERVWRPGNATVVVVGDVDVASGRRALNAALGAWRPGDVPAVEVEAAAQVAGRTIYLVDKPGAAQSIILIGRIGCARDTDDYYALEVMNTILGGSFTSRLNQNLREEHGYSYGARSNFDYRVAPGPWTAGAAVQTNATGPALREFFVELDAILEPIPAEEVERAKNFLAMRYPASFQSVAGIASRLGELVVHDLPAARLEEYTGGVLAVTIADVERAARESVDPANVAVVVVGDREAIEEQVRAEDLGEIRLLDVTDVLGPPPAASAAGTTSNGSR